MLIIILSWIVITALIYPVGFALNSFLGKQVEQTSANQQPFVLNCLSGFMAIGFIANVLCLFMPLNLTAFLIIVIITLLCIVIFRKPLGSNLIGVFKDVKRTNIFVTLSFLTFTLIISYCSHLPSSHYDDGLYYSTSIRWLQEYGTVKGLANLNPRIALNSTWHVLQALFGFRFLNMGLFNDLNGFFYLLIFLYSLGGIDQLLKGGSTLPVILRAIFFVPVLAFHFTANSDLALYNVNFLESSTPDIPVCFLVWLVFVLFMNARPVSERFSLNHLLIVLFSVWAISMKLSAMPILLLSVYIFIVALGNSKLSRVSAIVIVPLVFVVPWLIRNVLLSGYLLYPVAAVDLFSVDWKIGIENLTRFENDVKVFAVGADLSKPFTASITEWVPGWCKKQSFINKTILGFTSIAMAVYAIVFIAALSKKGKQLFIKNTSSLQLILVNLILFIGIIFWINKAPDFRFGYGFLCIFCTIFLAWIFRYFLESSVKYLTIPFFVFVCYLAVNQYGSVWYGRNLSLAPIKYRMPSETHDVNVNGLTIHIVNGEDSWNGPLPVANNHEFLLLNPELRGNTIQSGFRSTIQNNNKP